MGNIYGTFGIGQVHGQSGNVYHICVIEDEETLLKDKNIPFSKIFNFKELSRKLELHFIIEHEVNNERANPRLKKNSDGSLHYLLDEANFNEEDICADTNTILSGFFFDYNNVVLVDNAKMKIDYYYLDKLGEGEENFKTRLTEIKDELSENVIKSNLDSVLKDSRNKIIKNQQLISQLNTVIDEIKKARPDIVDIYANTSSSDVNSSFGYANASFGMRDAMAPSSPTFAPSSPIRNGLASPLIVSRSNSFDNLAGSVHNMPSPSPLRLSDLESPEQSPIQSLEQSSIQSLEQSSIQSPVARNLFPQDGGKNTTGKKTKKRKKNNLCKHKKTHKV
jgi:hypothetical protein